MNNKKDSSQLLRITLRINAIFSGLSGLLCLLAFGYLASLLGIGSKFPIIIIGLALLAFAIDLLQNSLQRKIDVKRATIAVAMDFAWVIGSAVVLWILSIPFTEAGRWLIFIIADLVFVFALLQFFGLHKIWTAI